MASFIVKHLLSLIRLYLFIFIFISITLGDGRWIEKHIAVLYVRECYMFSSKSFIVSSLTCRSLIHFECAFVYGDRAFSTFVFTYSCPVFSAPFIEETVFPPLYSLDYFVIQ